MEEINDINNLIGLCPNHHWELDHNLLSDEDRKIMFEAIEDRKKLNEIK